MKLSGLVGDKHLGNLLGPLTKMLTGGGGSSGNQGVSSMLDQLRKGGLGGQVDSWLSQGGNEPVKPGDLTRALGKDRMGRIAHQAGLSRRQASKGLAQLLPQVIDKLSPNGALLGGDEILGKLGNLGGLLGR